MNPILVVIIILAAVLLWFLLSFTLELIRMKEAEARYKHGWVTVQGAESVVVKDK